MNACASQAGPEATVRITRSRKGSVILAVNPARAQVPSIALTASNTPPKRTWANASVSPIGLVMIALYINHIHILATLSAWGPAQGQLHSTVSHVSNMLARTRRENVFAIKDGKERIALIFQVADVLQNVRLAPVPVLMSV